MLFFFGHKLNYENKVLESPQLWQWFYRAVLSSKTFPDSSFDRSTPGDWSGWNPDRKDWSAADGGPQCWWIFRRDVRQWSALFHADITKAENSRTLSEDCDRQRCDRSQPDRKQSFFLRFFSSGSNTFKTAFPGRRRKASGFFLHACSAWWLPAIPPSSQYGLCRDY